MFVGFDALNANVLSPRLIVSPPDCLHEKKISAHVGEVSALQDWTSAHMGEVPKLKATKIRRMRKHTPPSGQALVARTRPDQEVAWHQPS